MLKSILFKSFRLPENLTLWTKFQRVGAGGTLYVPQGSSGYDVWMDTGYYYLGYYNWTKIEQ